MNICSHDDDDDDEGGDCPIISEQLFVVLHRVDDLFLLQNQKQFQSRMNRLNFVFVYANVSMCC